MSIDTPSPDSRDAGYYSDITHETPNEKGPSAQELAVKTARRAAIAPKSLKPEDIKDRGLAADGHYFL